MAIGYEACGLGYKIYDGAVDAGFTWYVLATVKMATSPLDGKRKTDDYDAQKTSELLRSPEVAGLTVPTVWVPGRVLRDDRELIRKLA